MTTNENVVILSVEYSYLISSVRNSFYSSRNGLWKESSKPGGADYGRQLFVQRVMDNMDALRRTAASINSSTSQGKIELMEPNFSSQLITIVLRGTRDFVTESRRRVLKEYNQINFKRIQISRSQHERFGPDFIEAIEKISKRYGVELLIDNIHTDFKTYTESSTDSFIYIVGNQDNITVAETRIRILIDIMINRMNVDFVSVDLSLIPLIGGVDLFNFNQTAKQSNANIYIPDLLPELFNSRLMKSTKKCKVFITSSNALETVLTKNILLSLVEKLEGSLYQKEVNVMQERLDSMILFNQSSILNMMFKTGTFVQMSSLGQVDGERIVVQGQSSESVKETIYDMTSYCSQYYTLSFKFDKQVQLSRELEFLLLNLIQSRKTVMITLNSSGMDIHGHQQEIRSIIQDMHVSSYIIEQLVGHFSMKLRMEINSSQKDFISGKKNGKLSKIVNQLNQKIFIKFEKYNGFNFHIDILTANEFSVMLKAVQLIEMEFPAELRFNIPEVFHKSIIGNGGSIIQSVMKKYNVFIKFSSSIKQNEPLLYSFKRFDNVLIKCPQKNAKNISLAKTEIDSLVQQCCLNNNIMGYSSATYNTVSFRLLKSHYLLIINNNMMKSIYKLEEEHGTFIDFPRSIDDFKDQNELRVQIKGSDSRPSTCFAKLHEMLPKNYEFQLTYSLRKFRELESSTELSEKILMPFKLFSGVEMILNEKPFGSDISTHHQIILSYYNKSHLSAICNSLTTFLREKNFLILDKQPLALDLIVQDRLESVDRSAGEFRSATNLSLSNIAHAKRNQCKVSFNYGGKTLNNLNFVSPGTYQFAAH